MKKLNIKVRLKNPAFWVTFIPTLVTFIYSILAVIDVVPRISESTVISAVSAVFGLLTTLGVTMDPTTEGIGDSERAMGYDAPASDKKAGEDDDV